MSRPTERSPNVTLVTVGAIVLAAVLIASVAGILRWSSAVGELTGRRPGLRDAVAFFVPAQRDLRVPEKSAMAPAFVPIEDVSPDAFREPADPRLVAQLPGYEAPTGGARAAAGDAAYTPDPDRLNILLLGIPGQRREGGGHLTDAIVIASLDQRNRRVAAISIPRDLYVSLPDASLPDVSAPAVSVPAVGDRYKINAAYAIGERRFGDGLAYAMQTVSQVAGVPIHHAFRIDMPAFAELVDALGGVDVRVHRDFVGTEREGISVQRGLVPMDGATALAYARSRKTTDDFDRSRRQREVLSAIRKRLTELRNPFEMLGLLEIVARNAESTLSAGELRQVYQLYADAGAGDVVDLGFDTSADGRLQAMRSPHGEYILVPRAGSFAEIQDDVRGVFERQGTAERQGAVERQRAVERQNLFDRQDAEGVADAPR